MNIPTHRMQSGPPASPPLESGDHLTREEFERRYEAMPELKKAELIEGVVYMPSPVRVQHGDPHIDFAGWLAVYRGHTPGVLALDNATVRLDEENEPQPDALLMIRPEHGGQARVSEDGYVVGPPELVVEVAVSSVSIDLHEKQRAYARNGVREYIVCRVNDEVIDWFMLRAGAYEPHTLDPGGRYRSECFPGLWLDAGALLRGDFATLLRVLQEGIASPEHQAFVAKLEQARKE